MFQYRTLENTGPDELYGAFMSAFSDYSVPVDMTKEQFFGLLARNGYVPALSAGVYDGDMLAGFIINGVRQWNGVLTAYDNGTGVVPAYRKQGLTTGMFAFISGRLKEKGVRQCLLEVIQTNLPAYKLYQKLGFTVSREFSCFRAGKDDIALTPPVGFSCSFERQIDEEKASLLRDYAPAWQNTLESACSVPGDCIIASVERGGELAGYAAANFRTGSVFQLAVSPKYRGLGIGAGLLRALLAKAESPKISFLNVESGCESMTGFLMHSGFRLEVEQYEMLKPL
jgi:ribosomal protein S18 acetylase RimI-like enzyme